MPLRTFNRVIIVFFFRYAEVRTTKKGPRLGRHNIKIEPKPVMIKPTKKRPKLGRNKIKIEPKAVIDHQDDKEITQN